MTSRQLSNNCIRIFSVKIDEVQSTCQDSVLDSQCEPHYFDHFHWWQINQCLFNAIYSFRPPFNTARTHWIMIARASPKRKGKRKTLSLLLNIHNLIYSIIIYYSTPFPIGSEKNMRKIWPRQELFLFNLMSM